MEDASNFSSENFSLSIAQLQEGVYKIKLKGIYTIVACQLLQEKLLHIESSNTNRHLYLIIDFSEFEFSTFDAQELVLKRNGLNQIDGVFLFYGLEKISREQKRFFIKAFGKTVFYLPSNHIEAMKMVDNFIKKSHHSFKAVLDAPKVIRKNISVGGESFEMIHKSSWTYAKQDESYFYEINIVDKNIIISHPSGFIDQSDALITNVLFDSVVNENFEKDEVFYRILDYSNVVSTSFKTRTDFVNHISKNMDRIPLLVFFGMNSYMKAYVKIGKMFYASFDNVQIVNTLNEALLLVLKSKYSDNAYQGNYHSKGSSVYGNSSDI